MTDFDRPPASSRETVRRYEDTLSATLESKDMNHLLSECVKTARNSFVVPLIIKREDSRELASFTRRCLAKIAGNLSLQIVTTDTGVPNHVVGECGLLVLDAHLLQDATIEALEAEHLDYPAVRITVLAFPSEKAYKETRQRLSSNYHKRLSMPLKWPSLKDRKADLGGLISAVWDAVSPKDGKPTLPRDTRTWLLNKHGETVEQLYANMRKAVELAQRIESPTVNHAHFEADTRKDVRAHLYETAPNRRLTPTPTPAAPATSG